MARGFPATPSPMSERPGFLRRLFIEGPIIVISILLAFAIDAWWQDQEEEEDLLLALRAVHAQLLDNREKMLDFAGQHETIADIGAALLQHSGQPVAPEDRAEVSRMIGQFWNPSGDILDGGAMNAIIYSGLFSRLDHTELGRALADWNQQTRSAEVFQNEINQHSLDTMEPLLNRYIAKLDVELVGGFAGNSESMEVFRDKVPEKSRFESDLDGLMMDREFENIIVTRTALSVLAVDWLRNHAEETGHVIELVERRLQ